MVTKLNRFDVCLVNLDPTLGAEMKKTRPCVVISPQAINHSRLPTAIIAPMTSTVRKNFPTRVGINFQKKAGQIALDQLRSIDKVRIIKKLGKLKKSEEKAILDLLRVMFAE